MSDIALLLALDSTDLPDMDSDTPDGDLLLGPSMAVDVAADGSEGAMFHRG